MHHFNDVCPIFVWKLWCELKVKIVVKSFVAANIKKLVWDFSFVNKVKL